NDRWRDLLVAYVTWLGGQHGCALSVGSNSSILLDDKLMSVISPFSIANEGSAGAMTTEPEDALDSDDEWDASDPFDENVPDDLQLVALHDCVGSRNPIACGTETGVRLQASIRRPA